MKVNVEVITGTFIDTEVNENATVKELKEKIGTVVKLSVKRLIFVIGDERRIVMENEDDMMLRDLGVIEDSHVYLFFKHLDLVSNEERSRGIDDDMEEISSVAESGRGDEEEEEEKAKIDGEEEEDKAMNHEKEEDGDEKGEDEEKEKNEEEAKDDDEDDNVKEEAKEVENKDNKEET